MGYYQTQDIFPEDRPFTDEESAVFVAELAKLSRKVRKSRDMCHAESMALHVLNDDEKDTLKNAALIADPANRVLAVEDLVQILVDKHVAQRAADMTARFQQSLDDYLMQQQEGTL